LCIVDCLAGLVAISPILTDAAHLQKHTDEYQIHHRTLRTRTKPCKGRIGGLLDGRLKSDVVKIEIP
jgi:hypothetical protein